MKKAAAIFLLVTYLLGHTALGQLCKLPRLLSHFKEHKAQSPQMSFLEFVYMHYWGDDGNKADDRQDAQLPFKQADSGENSVLGYWHQLNQGLPARPYHICKAPCLGQYVNQYRLIVSGNTYRPPCMEQPIV